MKKSILIPHFLQFSEPRRINPNSPYYDQYGSIWPWFVILSVVFHCVHFAQVKQRHVKNVDSSNLEPFIISYCYFSNIISIFIFILLMVLLLLFTLTAPFLTHPFSLALRHTHSHSHKQTLTHIFTLPPYLAHSQFLLLFCTFPQRYWLSAKFVNFLGLFHPHLAFSVCNFSRYVQSCLLYPYVNALSTLRGYACQFPAYCFQTSVRFNRLSRHLVLPLHLPHFLIVLLYCFYINSK